MKKTKIMFEVYEEGFERHEGKFETIFFITDKLQNALQKYNEELSKIKKDKDFFIYDNLDNAEESTHTPSVFNYSVNLPIFSVKSEDGFEWYEFSVRTVEMELNESDKKFAIMITRSDYIDSDDEISTWNDYHKKLLDSYDKAELKLEELINQELKDLQTERGNNKDHFLDENEKTIYDSESGCDIPVAHYYIIEFENDGDD